MPADQSRIKELNRLGGNFFTGLCIPKLTPTSPGFDENGWDYFVEFPQNEQEFIPLDEQVPPLKCLIQLKTTDNFASRSLPMKLSNWRHLSNAPLPAFIFVVDFRGSNTPYETFLCHIGEERVGSALRRIREAEAQGSRALHKTMMPLHVREDEIVLSPSPDTFIESITRYAGLNLAAYSALKAKWCATAGYAEDRYIFRFNTAAAPEEFVEASLGLLPLQIDDFVVVSKRFGIEIETTRGASGTLYFESRPSVECQISAHSPLGRATIHAMANVPFNVANIAGYFKIIIHAAFLEFTVSSESCKASLQFDPNENFELSELLDFAEFICVCLGEEVRFQFKYQGKTFAKSEAAGLFKYEAFYFALRNRLRVIVQFLQKLRVPKHPRVSAAEVMRRELDLRLPALVVGPNGQTVSYLFDQQVLTDRKGIFAIPVPFALGELELVAFCYWAADVSFKDAKLSASLDECVIWEWQAVVPNDHAAFHDTCLEFEKFCYDLKPSGAVIFQRVELVDADRLPEKI